MQYPFVSFWKFLHVLTYQFPDCEELPVGDSILRVLFTSGTYMSPHQPANKKNVISCSPRPGHSGSLSWNLMQMIQVLDGMLGRCWEYKGVDSICLLLEEASPHQELFLLTSLASTAGTGRLVKLRQSSREIVHLGLDILSFKYCGQNEADKEI